MKSNIDKEITKYQKRYSEYYLPVIDEAISCFAKTRSGNQISKTVILREYDYWAQFPIKNVIAALNIYIGKKYYLEKKNEKYARGIIRRISDEQINQTRLFNNDQLKDMLTKLKRQIIDSCKICQGTGHTFNTVDIARPTARTCDCIVRFNKRRDELLKANKGEL